MYARTYVIFTFFVPLRASPEAAAVGTNARREVTHSAILLSFLVHKREIMT